jgi:hypothetical protein
MHLVKKALAGFCLLIGLPITLWAIVDIANPATDAEERSGAAAALFLFGLPPATLGTWLVWHLHQHGQQSVQMAAHQQEQLFLKLLQTHGGQLTIIQFATATQMPLEEAKAFLDEKARFLDASFDVSETGAVVYRFPL